MKKIDFPLNKMETGISWLIPGDQIIPIPGFKTLKQVEENISALEFGSLSKNKSQGSIKFWESLRILRSLISILFLHLWHLRIRIWKMMSYNVPYTGMKSLQR